MALMRKLKLIYHSTAQHHNNFAALSFYNFIQNILDPPSFKTEGIDYAFYMRDYKRETIKLLPFYMTDFLFIEL